MKRALSWTLLAALLAIPAWAATITLTSPNGGENWPLGTTREITWDHSGARGDARLILLNAAGERQGVIATVPVADGRCAWIVGLLSTGATVPAGEYHVRINIPLDGIDDRSNAPFSIGAGTMSPAPPSPQTLGPILTRPRLPTSDTTVRVTHPNGGERLVLGQETTITWEHENARPGQFLKVSLVSSSGRCRNEIGQQIFDLGNIPLSSGSFRWEINPVHRYGAFNSIRLSPAVAGEFSPDESDFCFRIDSPDTSVRVVSPNGGEFFPEGSTIDIRWEIANPQPWQRVRVWAVGWDPSCTSSTGVGSWVLGLFPIDVNSCRSGHAGASSWTRRPGKFRIEIRVEADIPSPETYMVCHDASDSCFTILE